MGHGDIAAISRHQPRRDHGGHKGTSARETTAMSRRRYRRDIAPSVTVKSPRYRAVTHVEITAVPSGLSSRASAQTRREPSDWACAVPPSGGWAGLIATTQAADVENSTGEALASLGVNWKGCRRRPCYARLGRLVETLDRCPMNRSRGSRRRGRKPSRGHRERFKRVQRRKFTLETARLSPSTR